MYEREGAQVRACHGTVKDLRQIEYANELTRQLPILRTT